MSLSLRHIEIFWAVMTSGSVTGAADLLHTSQPTVSRELARLETLTGLTLFDRVRGRLQPTAQALMLFEEVQRSYFGLERIRNTAASIRQFQQGQLSIACLPAFSQSLLPEVCRRFLAVYPEVSLSIVPQESPLLEEWLSAQRHDLGLTEHGTAPAGTRIAPLMRADEVCVLPDGHPLLARTALAPADLAGQNFISLSATDPYRQQLDSLFGQAGIERRLVVETHSAASVCAMVRAGLGVAVVNPLTALDYAGHGLAMRRFTVSIPFTVSVVRPEHRPSSQLAEHFVEALQQQAAELTSRLEAALALA